MINLTPTERRRLRESHGSDDPMFIAEAEDAMAEAQAQIDAPQRVYIAACFKCSTAQTLLSWANRFGWREMPFGETGCTYPHVNVEDAANLELDARDPVLIDSFGRINGFRHRGSAYLIAES